MYKIVIKHPPPGYWDNKTKLYQSEKSYKLWFKKRVEDEQEFFNDPYIRKNTKEGGPTITGYKVVGSKWKVINRKKIR